jgi:CheY-like chemotaxis protein
MLDLAAALHEIVPDLPILVATASADAIRADALAAAGVSEVVHRPPISAEIASALARYLRISTVSAGELQS